MGKGTLSLSTCPTFTGYRGGNPNAYWYVPICCSGCISQWLLARLGQLADPRGVAALVFLG